MADLATIQALLDATNTAILDLVKGGQEVRVNGRSYRRAELSQLREMRRELETEVARLKNSTTGAIRSRQVVPVD